MDRLSAVCTPTGGLTRSPATHVGPNGQAKPTDKTEPEAGIHGQADRPQRGGAGGLEEVSQRTCVHARTTHGHGQKCGEGHGGGGWVERGTKGKN